MPRRPGTDVIRLNVRGAGRVAAEFSRAQRQLQDDLIDELRDLGDDVQAALQAAAPDDTGDLEEAIEVVPYLRALRPRVSIRVGPLTGHEGEAPSNFDYLQVSRRGHRSRRIYPTTRKALKVHLLGHRNAQFFVFRASVRGYGHPTSADIAMAARRGGRGIVQVRDAARPVDWVEEAQPIVDRMAAESERRLSRRIGTRVL